MSDDEQDVAHAHSYRTVRIIDHCHWQEEVRACRCGTRHTVHLPRDFNDGTQRAYASEDCNNCVAKLAFLPRPAHWTVKL